MNYFKILQVSTNKVLIFFFQTGCCKNNLFTNLIPEDGFKTFCMDLNSFQVYISISMVFIVIHILLITVSADLAHRLDRLLQVRYDVAAIAAVILT